MSNFIERTIAVLESLETENAKLCDERDRMYKANVEKNGEILRLLDENAKLRELADLLLCGINNDVPPAEGLVWSQKVNVLMRELGIEVDE